MKKIMNRIERFIVIQLVIFVMVGELSVEQMVKEEAVEVDEGEVFGVGFPGVRDVKGEEVAVHGFDIVKIGAHAVVAVEDDDGGMGFFLFDDLPEDGEDEGIDAGDAGAGIALDLLILPIVDHLLALQHIERCIVKQIRQMRANHMAIANKWLMLRRLQQRFQRILNRLTTLSFGVQ